MKRIHRRLFVAVALSLAAPALAQPPSTSEMKVVIRGMVCAFCATGLKKVFSAEKGVQAVDVNLDSKVLTLTVAKGAGPSEARIRQLVKDAGYDVVKVELPAPPVAAPAKEPS